MIIPQYGQSKQHRTGFQDIQKPLCSERVSVDPKGEFDETIDAADLVVFVKNFFCRIEDPAYLDEEPGDVQADQDLTHALRDTTSDILCFHMELPHDGDEQRDSHQLQRKASDQDVCAGLLLCAFPVIRRSNPAATRLSHETDNIRRDERPRQPSRRYPKYPLLFSFHGYTRAN